jgi:hypothetical protein
MTASPCPESRKETFTVPVIEGVTETLREPVGPGAGTEDDPAREPADLPPDLPDGTEIEVGLQTHDQQEPSISVTTYDTDGARQEYYSFRVTDTDRRLCAYQKAGEEAVGYEEVPRSVRRALAMFGYPDVTGPSGEGIWFPSYFMAAYGLLKNRGKSQDSALGRWAAIMAGSMASLGFRTLATLHRFDTPAEVPPELVEGVFKDGQDSPLVGATAWDVVGETELATDVGAAGWLFPTDYVPLPPVDAAGATLGLDGAPGKIVTEAAAGEASEQYRRQVGVYIEQPTPGGESDTEYEDVGIQLSVALPREVGGGGREAEPGDYISTTIYGVDGIARHEFRVSDTAERTCVYEPRDGQPPRGTGPLPPWAAVQAVTQAGWTITNLPRFHADAPAVELVENLYLLLDRTTSPQHDPLPDGVDREDLMLGSSTWVIAGWMVLVIEQELSPGALDLVTRQTGQATGADVSSRPALEQWVEDLDVNPFVRIALKTVEEAPEERKAATYEALTTGLIARRLAGTGLGQSEFADQFKELKELRG